jgi:hypothetical protein
VIPVIFVAKVRGDVFAQIHIVIVKHHSITRN